MSTRIAMTAAFTLIFAGPAIADCNHELKALEQNVVAAATGASTSETGIPGTKHQKEVLGKPKVGESETTGATAPAVTSASPHQEQVTKRGTQSAEHASQLIAEARRLSAAGNEQECMKKAAELKVVLGMK
jgi:hypothetical protein